MQGGISGGPQVIALLPIQGGVVQQPQHAKQPLKRGSDFVAHVGQENAFAMVGLFCLGFGHLEVQTQGF